MEMFDIRFNVIVYSKEETIEHYNRIYYKKPTLRQLRRCVKRFQYKNDTKRFNGVSLFVILKNKNERLVYEVKL